MEIRRKRVTEMTTSEYRFCHMANYKDNGYMQNELENCFKYPDKYPGEVILIWEGPENRQSSLYAWCLITPIRSWGLIHATAWNRRKAKYTAQFWVKRNRRRMGYGRMLMDEVIKIDPCPHVFPHSESSAALFVDYNVTSSARDYKWLQYAKAHKKWLADVA